MGAKITVNWVLELDPLQITALALIVGLFVIALFGINRQRGFFAQIAEIAPVTLTTLGIFFTFLGILVSLFNFDVKNIGDSVPQFLGGLKLAFLSSVFGLGFSVLFRAIQAVWRKNEIAGEVTAQHLLDALERLNSNTLLVREALVGDGEASLSTQFGKLRNDFRDFARNMQENGTEALVRALEAVIRDFNEQINAQFGENFRQLNEAVAALLEWQQQHKEQVEMITRAFEETRRGIESVERSAAQIPDHMQAVETAFNKTGAYMEQLYEGLESISAMRESAERAIPELRQSIDSITSGMRESIDGQFADLKEVQSSISVEIRGLTEGLGRVVSTSLEATERSMNDQMESFRQVLGNLNSGADNVLDSTKQVAQRVEKMLDEFTQNQQQIAGEIRERINQSLADNVEVMNNSLQKLDEGMQEGLQRALNMMGNNLTAITEAFVNTYIEGGQKLTELTESLTNR